MTPLGYLCWNCHTLIWLLGGPALLAFILYISSSVIQILGTLGINVRHFQIILALGFGGVKTRGNCWIVRNSDWRTVN